MANVDCLFLLDFETKAGVAASSSGVEVAEQVSSADVDAAGKSGDVQCAGTRGKHATSVIETSI